MKKIKWFSLIMCVVLVFALTACGGGSEPAAEDSLPEASPDGQNPVMNVVGDYVCDRARIHIDAEGMDGAAIKVNWAGSATENATWTMSGTFNDETKQIEYSDCVKTNYVYDDNGEVKSQEEVYTGGTGVIAFGEGNTLTWQDDKEKAGEGMTFEFGTVNAER